ncbi:hypothetical protein ABFA07_011817 [Porites harrisoni]
MASETSGTTLQSGRGRGEGKGERQNRSERETPPSLSPFLPRTLFDACHEGCKNVFLRYLRIQSHAMSSVSFTCLFVFWGRVGGEKWGSSQNNCQRSLIGEACSVFDKLKNTKCRWASYYVLN